MQQNQDSVKIEKSKTTAAKKQVNKNINLIIFTISLIAVGIIAIVFLIRNSFKQNQTVEYNQSNIQGKTPQYLIETQGEIVPDYDSILTYQKNAVTGEDRLATIISQVISIEGRKITLYGNDQENYFFDIPEDTKFYQFYQGDKENYFPASFEDIKVGSIITYYVPWEEMGRIGSIYIRIEK